MPGYFESGAPVPRAVVLTSGHIVEYGHCLFPSRRALRSMLALAAILIAAPSQEAEATLFGPATSYPANGGARFAAFGDVNRDGRLDLVVTNDGTETISLRLGNGNGTFGDKADLATGLDPYYVAIEDVSGDGRPDLLAANYSSNSVSVLLGNGDGTFADKTDFATGPNPSWIAIADLDRDGRLDLVVANEGFGAGTTLSVLLGNGDGTFGAKTDYTAGVAVGSVAIGDLNRDGKLDVAVSNGASHTISVLLGTGNGTLEAKTDYPTGMGPNGIRMADLDRDGKLDIVVANGQASSVGVLLGNGNGAVGTMTTYATGGVPRLGPVEDLNHDGELDLMTANQGPSTVSVLLGMGGGAFAPATDYATGDTPISLAAGDADGDGQLDLATGNYGANAVSVLLNIGGTVDVPRTTRSAGLSLAQSRPNPAAEAVTINFSLPRESDVNLSVFDVTGRKVATLLDGPVPAGTHTVKWDSRLPGGRPAARGVYRYELRALGTRLARHLVLLR
jgi:hypothetical protein